MKVWILALVILAAFSLAGCNEDKATSTPKPVLTSMDPNLVNRAAQHIVGNIFGQNLTGVTAVDLGAGINVESFNSISAAQVEVTFSVDTATDTGQRTVTVTTSAGAGSAALLSVENALPVAVIKVSPGKGDQNTEFAFNGTGSFDPDGKVKEYLWDFDDGTKKSHDSKVTHVFEKSGKRNVTLTVTDNSGNKHTATKDLTVDKATQIACTKDAGNRGLIFGNVIGVEPGNVAVVKFPGDRTCSNTYYKCGDLRRANATGTAEFYGIIKSMHFRGDSTFAIENKCPLHWPPQIGQRVFLIYKTCAQNFCP